MGVGISAMHYVGMDAMRLPAMCEWDIVLVTLSVVIAVPVSLVALFLTLHLRTDTRTVSPLKLASAAVMGLAIAGMHYTGMAGATFVPDEMHGDLTWAVDISALGITAIALVTLMVLGLAIVTSLVDRRFSAQSIELRTSETLSLGASCTTAVGFEAAALIQTADQALYQAKTRGRNRVEGY